MRLNNKAASANEQGVTWANLLWLIAIAALLILALWMIPDLSPHIEARSSAARAQIALLEKVLADFRTDNGFFPTGTNALRDLVYQPPGTTNWHGPYLKEVPKDPWGRDYIYKYPGTHTKSIYPYDLSSLGGPPHNQPIVNWTD